MLSNIKVRSIYTSIQDELFDMIPEKWEKLCLYASVFDNPKSPEPGEMFFYYFPTGLLKKNPINVYEIPGLYNIEEVEYFKLVNSLYSKIKELKFEYKIANEPLWTNLTIIIEDFKFIIEYNYEDLINSPFDNYQRHVIWRYLYLGVGFEKCSREEKEVIKQYLDQNPYKQTIPVQRYEEPMYKKAKSGGGIHYRKERYIKEDDTLLAQDKILVNDWEKDINNVKNTDPPMPEIIPILHTFSLENIQEQQIQNVNYRQQIHSQSKQKSKDKNQEFSKKQILTSDLMRPSQ